MSILIPGLKMPPTMGIQIIIDCGQVWVKPFGGHPEKLSGQAIELPPHGRLIDADALEIPETEVDPFENCRNCQLLSKGYVLGIIGDAPTIIEAEGVSE